jgi:hypothetical protein
MNLNNQVPFYAKITLNFVSNNEFILPTHTHQTQNKSFVRTPTQIDKNNDQILSSVMFSEHCLNFVIVIDIF